MVNKEDIQLEASLLKSLATKKNFDKFYGALDTKRLIPITEGLLHDYKKYYEKYNEDINWETFYTEFSQNWHAKNLDHNDIVYYRDTVFPLIRNSEIGNHLYASLLEREASYKMEALIASGFSLERAQEIVNGLKRELQLHNNVKDEDIFKLVDLDLTVLDSSNGLTWFLNGLQAGIGSHMPGQFVVVTADSNAGKSAFCISQAVHTFKNLHLLDKPRPILYCTSEDTKEDLAARFLSNLYHDKCDGFEDVVNQFGRVRKHFEATYDNNLFIGQQIRSYKDVHKLIDKVDKYNPSLIIIDMLDTLSESGGHEHLKKTYDDIRGIANEGFPIIGTSQSGDTTYWAQDENGKPERKHRKKLGEKDAAGSKFGKQGAAYCMIGIGQDDDMPGVRYITTTKKKRGKNCSTTCQLLEQYSLYKELL